MKTLTINGETFELGKPMTKLDLPASNFQTIDDVYERPSQTKRAIYNDWFNWFYNNGGYCWISSFNCMMFTLAGLVTDKETKKCYYCYITKSHNRAYEIV